uniref:Reverse transcriptase domain-containing protein n=1 Tax=Bombyx mori TaxID=7091 RepID=A0A8R2QSM6_BOMMO|nr:uncharacterized protein LOC119628520 [Bombyx mori]
MSTPKQMERRNKSKRLMSLPEGDRRGTSGADAGCDSIRTVSGFSLNRRARAREPERTTADHNRDTDVTLQSGELPTSSAGPLVETMTSSVDTNDSRRKWSTEEIHELMFCYYKAKAEGVGFMKRLEMYFKERNPNNPKIHKFTGNTLSNQARSIINRKWVSTQLLQEIKMRAEQSNRETNSNLPDNNTILVIPSPLVNNTQPTLTTVLEHTPTDNVNVSPYTQANQLLDDEITDIRTDQYTLDKIGTFNIDMHTQQTQSLDEPEAIILQFLQVLSETKETCITDRPCLPKPKFNKTFIANLGKINTYIPNLLDTHNTLRELNNIIYATAKTLIIANGQKPFTPRTTIKPRSDPPWKRRIKNKLEDIRKELGRLVEIKKGVNSRRLIKIKDKLYEKYKIFSDMDHDKTVEVLSQRVKALAGRIKRYEDINKRKEQNKQFRENQHAFYRSLSANKKSPTEIPTKENIQQFWSSILSQPIPYNKQAEWIADIQNETDDIHKHNFQEITVERVKTAIRKTHNWKTPGLDKIQNYYLKYLTNIHPHITHLYNKLLDGRETLEEWFTTGQVILIPKNDNTQYPQNWRPIACLPTMYKLLTSIIANELYEHCETNDILAPEQRGCRRRARGCKDHLMINKAILEDAHQCQKNLSMGWVDYRKAFDSISHDWLLKVLELYKCSPTIIDFLKKVMPSWKVIMAARGVNASVTTDLIAVRRGIFQGDSLSPLLFCLGINPLSFLLNKYIQKGYKLKNNTAINHLLYMDDLKLYANNKNSLKVLLDSTEIFTRDIGMEFGLNKCNVLHLTSGRRAEHQSEGHILLSGLNFEHLKEDENYKYLGIDEAGKIDHKRIQDQVKREYFKRVKCITNTQLSARNLITAINTYATPVLLYTFGIINYKNSDLNKIDIKTRKILTLNKAQQQKADIERLYLPIEEGGRGLINIEMLHKTQIIKFRQYLNNEQDQIIKAIVKHDKHRDKHSIHKDGKNNAVRIELTENRNYTDTEIKKAVIKTGISKWKEKPLHGQFRRSVIEKGNIDREYSFRWLKKQIVSPTLESSVFAIQDQAVITRQIERDILKKSVDDKCRLCLAKDESIEHIISGCEKLAGTYYVNRHNNIVKYIWWAIGRKHNFELDSLWWKVNLTQPQIKENSSAKLMWEIPVQTDVTIKHNRPDIIYIDKTENKTYLIDITVPSDYNIGPKELEKLSKYHPLKVELTRLWNTHTETIPIVIGATGVVAKSIHRYIDKLEANINIHIIQKQAAIHTCTIISKVLGNTVFINSRESEPPLP